ncbi:DNA repair protein RecN [Clostridium argentinense CDC 2741]|uniref:DNA repair protein RecN n=1 Tax=Clostridium argentinense CDC 2741 TaxID=1418104 RepID=A0A0C1R3C3_9CLOT|nr:DNA repair protein RecN [Clostridium argentinense]ARC85222.1 DNA repair protein RecN [Clostridium argentinense]KIE48007.1 DNA repair protein RecN [Clostridium argentinense CDC 2741]NFF39474.1 DNA repair protein RecN [Clostridium argentinense]NFP50979.1 DNA repair protein RecN [Clostridium argentinense]NFP73627.1 DNA repair protein RecN [Clostridium argentinense]
MLLQLNIKNFALIEELSIDFEEGFNVLSGETGAGKSILIDAINYVLGGKFNKNLIRAGEEKTIVEAIFAIDNEKTKNILDTLEIDYDDVIVLTRESFNTGKSVAKVNNKTLILSKIKLISEVLLDIHGQHENQNLLDNSNHINYVDAFGSDKIEDLLKSYKENYDKLSSIEKKISDLKGNNNQREKNMDFIKFQIDEINNINPKLGEDEELEERFSFLSNAEKIEKSLLSSYNLLKNNLEEGFSVIDGLSYVIRELRTIENHKTEIKNISNALEECFYLIEQNIDEIRTLKDSIYYDEKELEFVNSRMYQLGVCKKKYGETITDVLNYKSDLEKRFDELFNSGEIIEKLEKEKVQLVDIMQKQTLNIHHMRVEISEQLEKNIKKELDYIGLDKSTFKIEIIHTTELLSNGSDKVQFNISTNPGQPLQPLEEIVSGGELSRIMLALKTVFVDKDEIPTVIFDEIDTGISGRIAQRVGEKMYLISKNHQVFCVTHLPQIASMADYNYLITKESLENTTYTNVTKMSKEDKKYEIARMIGGSEVTKLTLDNSEEMIEMANILKRNII